MELKMELNHLSDEELIDHIIRYDEDPVRVRLATIMQRTKGAIIDDLETAGMDPTFCNFRSIVNQIDYHPGRYIMHLEGEIEHLWFMSEQDRKEIKNLEARTIMDVFAELKQEIKTAEYSKELAIKDRESAERREQDMKHKLDMWAILQR